MQVTTRRGSYIRLGDDPHSAEMFYAEQPGDYSPNSKPKPRAGTPTKRERTDIDYCDECLEIIYKDTPYGRGRGAPR